MRPYATEGREVRRRPWRILRFQFVGASEDYTRALSSPLLSQDDLEEAARMVIEELRRRVAISRAGQAVGVSSLRAASPADDCET